ncbi:alpha-1,4-glucan--maltose-1-phosphate maltosyltransferase [soil metagenome]
MATDYEPRIGRIPIRDLSPRQPDDTWPAKAFRGEVLPFGATIFVEGHDLLGAELELTAPDRSVSTHPMHETDEGIDRWSAEARVEVEGSYSWRVRAWVDEWATWRHHAELKIPAGVDVALMLRIGAQLLTRAAATAPELAPLAKAMGDGRGKPATRFAIASDARVTAALAATPLVRLVTESPAVELRVERDRAGVGSWYEFFPRSEGAKRNRDGSWVSGTLRTAATRLSAVADLGFDVIYLPPIHPIGLSFRKGPDNSLTAGPNDPGSPWAIGSPDGGHDAIHPDLGSPTDFAYFVSTAKRLGMEVALDLALQCSPDHPWVTEHPEWFTTLPDGSIAYAENPPKKYQDIYPLNFDNDPAGLGNAVLRIVELWISRGVTIFRVDNPHTKPVRFWEWLIHEVNQTHPEIVFLAEAFTAPAMMNLLGQIGFQQSYTYFTWRNSKAELAEFLSSIAHETDAFLRPNLFVNTPDILSEYLQFGGVPAYKVRAALAATSAPSWGVYAGYELYENVARPGSEENIDNEKYEYRPRAFAEAEAAGRSLAPYLRTLNQIRREHPALRQLRNLQLHWSDDDSILVYSKHLPAEFAPTRVADTVIVVANLDPHSVRETTVYLDPRLFGVYGGVPFEVTDLITGEQFTWNTENFVRLDAFVEPVHILSVTRPSEG